MLFYLHYVLMTSGLSGTSVLLAVFFKTYTDASQSEIGALLMTFPFVSLIIKPLFCSMADRQRAHRLYLILSLLVEMAGYAPFIIIPFFPNFYTLHPRASWYILVAACHVGNGGLGVAWSLGDCLAMNYSQRTGVPFGRMRLMGTLSWGVYGFIIGQINELPMLPKYLPAFIILHVSLILELLMVVLWNKQEFEMVDPLANLKSRETSAIQTPASNQLAHHHHHHHQQQQQHVKDDKDYVDSMPSSLGGTLRLNPKTANVFRDVLASDELHRRLKAMESSDNSDNNNKLEEGEQHAEEQQQQQHKNANRNPQLILLKMILIEDGRIIKYICLFTIFGVLMAPMNFIFLSMEELCAKRDYNFSQLAGAVLISQALIETLAFLVVPWCMRYISKSCAMSVGFVIVSLKWIFYSGWYYSADISPYWAVISEWSHGLSYGIFATIQADVSLEFANLSRLFIPELRKLGFLTRTSGKEDSLATRERIEAEERGIKMALRATMQALFSGFMDGLGQGAGALLCGIIIEMYSYVIVWQIFFVITSSAFVIHLIAEVSKSRWSDTYEPRKGTKAYEIMQLTRVYLAEIAARRSGGKKKNAEVEEQKTSHDNKLAMSDCNKPAECC